MKPGDIVVFIRHPQLGSFTLIRRMTGAEVATHTGGLRAELIKLPFWELDRCCGWTVGGVPNARQFPYALELSLRKIDDDYDGNQTGSWDLCPWQPTKRDIPA